ncbi:MAG: MerR family DNA-binding protein [Pseudomonadales bacterium]|nr:MerR family DNA-binding protein [Pseudomonadales bacterium]NRA14134.1 MerR family DNA-binding protein [Oceanospirillaceae bacterium]
MNQKKLTISVLARKAKVGIETVRYYQRIGLITQPEKPLSGYRVYPQVSLDNLRFIAQAKQLGFSLGEIATLLQLGEQQCAQTKQLAVSKLALINSKISDLKSMSSALQLLIERCPISDNAEQCPIISSLSEQ